MARSRALGLCRLIGYTILLGLAVAQLNGCTTVQPAVTSCLPLTQYAPAFEQRAADELAALPADDPLAVLVSGYASMRAADRACLAAK